jgi:hypothetical protein
LAEDDIGACGTIRINRKGIPQSVKAAAPKKGESSFIPDNDLLYCKFHDRKVVTLVSNVHDDKMFEREVRAKGHPDNKRKIQKPKMVEMYNLKMGGVDLADQQVSVYLPNRRTLKWTKKVFLWLMEVCFVNSLIIARGLSTEKVDAKKFRLNLVERLTFLCRRNTLSKRAAEKVSRSGRLLQSSRHWPEKNEELDKNGAPKYLNCEVCFGKGQSKKRHRTNWVCRDCHGVPLCVQPCFGRYHSMEEYAIECTSTLHQ